MFKVAVKRHFSVRKKKLRIFNPFEQFLPLNQNFLRIALTKFTLKINSFDKVYPKFVPLHNNSLFVSYIQLQRTHPTITRPNGYLLSSRHYIFSSSLTHTHVHPSPLDNTSNQSAPLQNPTHTQMCV